ncbi:MAG TPA: ABC-2 family transporter protein [Candidatus Obscuribacterales bacterium]
MNSLRKYWAIAWISGKSNLAYVGEVGSRLFFLTVILYIFMRLWQEVFAHAHVTRFGGYGVTDMIWYLAATETILMSEVRVSSQIDEDVRTGAVAVQLVRPLSYPLYRLASNLGERAVRIVVTGFAAVLIATWLSGSADHLANGLLFFALALPGAFVLHFLGYLLVGLSAFWVEDTAGLTLIYSRLVMVLGGMLLPLELFPSVVQPLVKALPFGNIVCGPARLFIHPDPAALGLLLVNQLLWIGVFSLAASAVYSRALHRIALNGG